jgi:hypothetical protein
VLPRSSDALKICCLVLPRSSDALPYKTTRLSIQHHVCRLQPIRYRPKLQRQHMLQLLLPPCRGHRPFVVDLSVQSVTSSMHRQQPFSMHTMGSLRCQQPSDSWHNCTRIERTIPVVSRIHTHLPSTHKDANRCSIHYHRAVALFLDVVNCIL